MRYRVLIFVGVCVLLAGCSTQTPDPTPLSSPRPTIVAPTTSQEEACCAMEPIILGVAQVEEFDLQVNEEWSDLVEVTLRGNYPDDCTSVEEFTVDEQGGVLILTLHTRRPSDEECAQVLTPFEETEFLEMDGRPAGDYRVRIGEIEQVFSYAP